MGESLEGGRMDGVALLYLGPGSMFQYVDGMEVATVMVDEACDFFQGLVQSSRLDESVGRFGKGIFYSSRQSHARDDGRILCG